MYDVHLDTYEGPLDLLLSLIRKSDLEIKEIQVSEITSEYLACLDNMPNLNLDTAGDFLVMAATLMQIKAKMLNPANDEDKEDADAELDRIKERLLEYQKYKEVSKLLSNKEQEYSQTYYRPRFVIDEQDCEIDATMDDLVRCYQKFLRRLPEDIREVMYKEIPIEHKMQEILDILEGKQYLNFSEILSIQTSRQAMVVCFMAVLEMIKNRQILAKQSELFEDVRIYKVYDTSNDDVSIVRTEDVDRLDLKVEHPIEEKEEDVQPEPFILEQEPISTEKKMTEEYNGN